MLICLNADKLKRGNMSDLILEITHLEKQFGDFKAVKGVDFTIGRGQIFSLLGPNGAGKSTTISMLSCLLAPSHGDAHIDGHSIVNNPDQVKEVIGYVPQELALYDKLSAVQNLKFWGTMVGMSGRDLTHRIDELLERVELADRAKDRVETYSGGMKRRLNIAVGLLHKPKLVFMDEPTVGIDPQSRRRILDMVKELRDEGTSVLYTTHYMEEAEELSDAVGIIDHGKMIAIGSQAELRRTVGEQDVLRLHFDENAPTAVIAEQFGKLEFVTTAIAHENEIIVTAPDSTTALPVLFAVAGDQKIRSIDIEEPNLEAVFLHLTGRALRE
ncbi:MAG: ABC-2 type transport system ATP-binding protein [Candidatus Promineifilaceae bacterium]|jgi:ABC-2 type transport system ATP-binding protein